MPELTLQVLIQTFGPTGVLLAIAIASARTLVPAIQEYLKTQGAQLTRIADAVKTIEMIQATFGTQLNEVREDLDGMQLDIARIYENQQQPQPSRSRRKQPAQASQ